MMEKTKTAEFKTQKKEIKKEIEKEIEKPINEKKEIDSVIYVGPTIPKIVANSRVYINGLPAELQNLVEQNPIVSKFLIPITELREVQKKLNDKTSAYYGLYKEFEKELKKKKEVK